MEDLTDFERRVLDVLTKGSQAWSCPEMDVTEIAKIFGSQKMRAAIAGALERLEKKGRVTKHYPRVSWHSITWRVR